MKITEEYRKNLTDDYYINRRVGNSFFLICTLVVNKILAVELINLYFDNFLLCILYYGAQR